MKRIFQLVLLLALSAVFAHATVKSQNTSVTFTCTGSTGPYSFTFPISDPTALTVTQNGNLLASTAYTIAPVNNNYVNGGNVTLLSACPSSQTLVLQRVTPITQQRVFSDNMPQPMKQFEGGLDKLTEINQEQAQQLTNFGTDLKNAACNQGYVLQGVKPPLCVANGTGGGGTGPLPFINVKDGPYNAWGDSDSTCTTGHDDTAAIQAALNTAALVNGARVYMPPGYYKISANGLAYVNHTYKPLTLEGAGSYSTFLCMSSGTKIALDLGGSDNAHLTDFGIQANGGDIGILLARYATPGTNGPGGTHNLTNVSVNGTFNVAGVYAVASEDDAYTHNYFRSTSSAPSFYSSGTNQLGYTSPNGTILASTNSANTFVGNAFVNYGGGDAVVFYGTSPDTTLIGNYFFSTASDLALLGPLNGYTLGPFTINGNSFENTGGKSIEFGQTRLYNVFITNNGFAQFGVGYDIYQDALVFAQTELATSQIEHNKHTGGNPDIDLNYVTASSVIANANVRFSNYLINSQVQVANYTTTVPTNVTNTDFEQWGYNKGPTHIQSTGLPNLFPIGNNIGVGRGNTNPASTLSVHDTQTATTGSTVFTGTGLNDATSGGTFTNIANEIYCVQITTTGTPDKFSWGVSSDGSDCSGGGTGISITGAAQTLNAGVTVTFGATTGHTLNDKWTISCIAAGYTTVSIREGSAQSHFPLLAFKDPSGNLLTSMDETGNYGAYNGTFLGTYLYKYALALANSGSVKFFNNVDILAGSADVGIDRSSAGVVEIDNGSTGAANGSLSTNSLNANNTTVYGNLSLASVATPTIILSASTTGGTLNDATSYCYRVAALGALGTTLASPESCITTGTGGNLNSITVSISKPTGELGYNVYGRTTGAEQLMTPSPLGANVFTFVDTGSVSPSGAVPGANTTAGGLIIAGGTPITSQSSANSQMVTCPTGGSGTQVCDAAGNWISSSATAFQVNGTPLSSSSTVNFQAGTNITLTNPSAGNILVTASATAATAFSAITAATNTGQALLIGAGSSLDTTGGGTINATSIGGVTVTGTPSVGYVPVATSGSAAAWQAQANGLSGLTSGQVVIAGSPTTATSSIALGTSANNIPQLDGSGKLAASEIPNNSANTSGSSGSTTGNAATATALASAPTQCSAGSAPRGIAASGNAQSCTPYAQVICSGTITLGTSAIALASTNDNTATCSGLLTSDNIQIDFASDPTAVTGYGVAGDVLTLYKFATANTIHVVQGNNAHNSGSITPGAMTVNYRVWR